MYQNHVVTIKFGDYFSIPFSNYCQVWKAFTSVQQFIYNYITYTCTYTLTNAQSFCYGNLLQKKSMKEMSLWKLTHLSALPDSTSSIVRHRKWLPCGSIYCSVVQSRVELFNRITYGLVTQPHQVRKICTNTPFVLVSKIYILTFDA